MSTNQKQRLRTLMTFAERAASTAFLLAQGTELKLTNALKELQDSQERHDATYASSDPPGKATLTSAVTAAQNKVSKLQIC